MAEKSNIEIVQKSYDKEYCHQLELAYGDNFMSEGGGVESDRLLGDIAVVGKRVLDFGCGLGGTVFHLAEKHEATVIGFDINEQMLATARERTPDEIKDLISFVVGDGSNVLPFADNSFDVIFSKGVIIHLTLEQREVLFKEFYRVLRPCGRIAIFDPVAPQEVWGKDMQELSDSEALPIFAQTLDSYRDMLANAGFMNVAATDESTIYENFNNEIVTRLQSSSIGKQFAKQYGQALLDEHIKGYCGIARSLRNGEMNVITFRGSKAATAEKSNIEIIKETYSEKYCESIELAYGKNMLSGRGEIGLEELVCDIDLAGKQVLDFGTGLGGGAHFFAEKGAHVIGVDICEHLIAQAKQRVPEKLQHLISYRHFDGQDLGLNENSLDVIVCKEVIVHIDPADRAALFVQFYRALKPGGVLLVDDWFAGTDNEWSGRIKQIIEAESLLLYAQTPVTVQQGLMNAGFIECLFSSKAKEYAQFSRQVVAHLNQPAIKKTFIAEYGIDAFKEHLQGYNDVAYANEHGELVCGVLRARK